MFEYYVNGVPISDEPSGVRVLADSNLPGMSVRQVEQVSVAGIDGVFPIELGASTALVNLKVRVQRISHEPFSVFYGRCKDLYALFREAKTIGTFDGSKHCQTQIISVDLQELSLVADTQIIFGAVFTVQPFWRESGDPVVTATRLSTGVVTLGEFNRCTGKLVDAVIRFKGPFTSARVEGFNNTGVTVSGVFTASDYVFVDLANMRAWKSSSHDSWAGKGAPVDWDYPAGGMLTLEPDFETGRRRYALKLTTSGTTVQSAFSVRSSKWHL